jgi:hypothetical protein
VSGGGPPLLLRLAVVVAGVTLLLGVAGVCVVLAR